MKLQYLDAFDTYEISMNKNKPFAKTDPFIILVEPQQIHQRQMPIICDPRYVSFANQHDNLSRLSWSIDQRVISSSIEH